MKALIQYLFGTWGNLYSPLVRVNWNGYVYCRNNYFVDSGLLWTKFSRLYSRLISLCCAIRNVVFYTQINHTKYSWMTFQEEFTSKCSVIMPYFSGIFKIFNHCNGSEYIFEYTMENSFARKNVFFPMSKHLFASPQTSPFHKFEHSLWQNDFVIKIFSVEFLNSFCDYSLVFLTKLMKK